MLASCVVDPLGRLSFGYKLSFSLMVELWVTYFRHCRKTQHYQQSFDPPVVFCTIYSCFYYCMCAYCSLICVYFYDDVSGCFYPFVNKLIHSFIHLALRRIWHDTGTPDFLVISS